MSLDGPFNMSAAYSPSGMAVPPWLNKGDNAWQMVSATLVGLQSVPGLVILYGSIVKKKWAVNSAFMALYAFAAVWLCWVTWGYNMSFGHRLLPFWGKARPALGQKFLLAQAVLPQTTQFFRAGIYIVPQNMIALCPCVNRILASLFPSSAISL
uniref:Ammonium transporter AmtB-like domain-containing protein n=1 Tax=Oryza brachyantha TaxID=4533 RepID=J3L688_ORYBR